MSERLEVLFALFALFIEAVLSARVLLGARVLSTRIRRLVSLAGNRTQREKASQKRGKKVLTHRY